MRDSFYKIAAAVPELKVADCRFNAEKIEELIFEAERNGASAVVFPELSVTGYTCGDLFNQPLLISAAENELKSLIERTRGTDILCGVGLPVAHGGGLYNCIGVFKSGRLLGLVPKQNIPNYGEFYELRHFTPCKETTEVFFCGENVKMGEIIFENSNDRRFSVGFEVCEDLWVTVPVSTSLAMKGASVIMNASCSNEVVGKAQYRRSLVSSHSARILAAYCYTDSGFGESTTDMVFSGHRIITENGHLLSEGGLFTKGLTLGDVDVERLCHERQRMNTWCSVKPENTVSFTFNRDKEEKFKLTRVIEKNPFVPKNGLEERCGEIIEMQSVGLCKRLSHIGTKTAVIGLSGGLDSTLALLVTVDAFDKLGLERKGIKAVSMPCFGTTGRTKNNAAGLGNELKVDFSEISIKESVLRHFEDIGHDPNVTDTTYENAQARERTQLLMDLSNKLGGIVIGTGDLSELALGFATYNGDHMSMYGVNASIPKTLVRHLTEYFAVKLGGKVGDILRDILDTPVSPELLPPKDGEISQKTEDLVGPYELHDFFLYYFLRFGFSPDKIFRMAVRAFEGDYDSEVIKKWLKTFYSRFFSQQFKRSCLPDGPKVGTISLSPRGDLRMPSDASAALWLKIVEEL